jgi:hypothetical protein
MADIYEWLRNVEHPYAPTSPPFHRSHFTEIPTDEVPFLDSNAMGNTDFNAPIDPALHSSSEFPTSGLAFVTVPEQFAETSSRILVHFVQILEAAETVEGQNEGIPGQPTFTAEELEALEPIVEEDPKPNLPSQKRLRQLSISDVSVHTAKRSILRKPSMATIIGFTPHTQPAAVAFGSSSAITVVNFAQKQGEENVGHLKEA